MMLSTSEDGGLLLTRLRQLALKSVYSRRQVARGS